MNIREALSKYFGRYENVDAKLEAENVLRAEVAKKKKKKKGIRAGSYFKKARRGYEEALKEAGDY